MCLVPGMVWGILRLYQCKMLTLGWVVGLTGPSLGVAQTHTHTHTHSIPPTANNMNVLPVSHYTNIKTKRLIEFILDN